MTYAKPAGLTVAGFEGMAGESLECRPGLDDEAL